ncbi:MerR family transcriptional regulator [Desulfurispirillum indicum]|uniref:Regulatory protein MerR n=1 Tax=Desulfurispirillum indicum (strain ATCC BAA-1389 / DSM 22839 / S5) TaxID=653733 RepID=E6W6A0_DESIS|nr:MerR family transcriptional regulator [Desulfurispirillum indicum]ADU66136.1 regulatory protein MerR [Desulfurispirillum indicum S5]UCZ55541.1 MerR family transcriptional regulator [Desulfurispirillum indicum]
MPTQKSDLIPIGEVANQLGITTRTIRYYEEIGLMGCPERLSGNTRMYGRPDILRLKFILKLKELGITLKEMQELAENFDVHNQDFATITPKLLDILDSHINKVDEKIAKLSSLRKEVVEYRARIVDILKGKTQPIQ